MATIPRVHSMALSKILGRIAAKADHHSRHSWSFKSGFTANQFKRFHGQCSFQVAADCSKPVVLRKKVNNNQYTCYSTLKTLAAPENHVQEEEPGTVKRGASEGVPGQTTHTDWWNEKLQQCRKPLTKEMMKRLKFTNPLGLDESLRGGSLKKGTKSGELLEMKGSFPREVFLCRTGDVYEAVGIDACILVEYVGVAPVGRKDSVPKAACPVVNLRQAIDELTQQGFSVCVVEEVQGSAPTGRGRRKERFIAGHAHPGSPYVYGVAAQNIDLEFPDAVSVVGISHSETGYCLIFASEIMRTFALEDGLTEEAAVALLRAQRCHKLYTHVSLHLESSTGNGNGSGSWGKRGLLWSECRKLQHDWYDDDDPVDGLLSKVREIYGLGVSAEFREILVPPGERPRPLYVGTASQIGIIPTSGVPSLLNVVLPEEANHLCVSYLKNLLLHPPPHRVAECIQGACAGLKGLTSPVPDFTCVSAAKLKRLIEAKEANHVELSRIQRLAEDVLFMSNDPQLTGVLDLLLEPAWLATGLRIGRKQLITDCKMLTSKLGQMLASEGDLEQERSQGADIPDDFFRDFEDSWRGRVRREHAEQVYREVDEAANELISAVKNDFCPILSDNGDNAAAKALKVEICYSYDDQAVWLQGKLHDKSSPAIKCLAQAVDAKGKKVGEEWWTTRRVETALSKYRAAVENGSVRILELLRAVAEDLQPKTEVLIFVSTLSVIAKTLYMHVAEGARRNWVVPTLSSTDRPMVLDDVVPYWNDRARENVQPNMVQMNSMFLLTGPNGGGKSSMLRSICAGALLATCGLMVPARRASVPRFDAIILRMMSTDSPADGKSAFQMEMAELKTILAEATDKSLVLVDELCRGTDVGKGSFIAASVIETLDRIGCIGVLSTHLHDLLDMELRTNNVVQMAMGTSEVDGRYYPTWKLVKGACRESLAFEVARKEGVPADVVDRAEELCVTKMLYPNGLQAANQDFDFQEKGAKRSDDDDRMTADKLFLIIARFVIKLAKTSKSQ